MSRTNIRNVAIIAHVDHGKTTLVDQLLRQSGQFRKGELIGECILDTNPLEKERGITILSKNCAIDYTDEGGRRFHINIVDTPGHADFSGEVERVLKMADGVLLLVDAFEGVMPQTRYVLSKALAIGLKPIVVINKMDRPGARPRDVVSEVFDLLVDLNAADDHALHFRVVYTSARDGWASTDINNLPSSGQGNIQALFHTIIDHIPAPDVNPRASLQALVVTLDYSDFVGRIGIGRVFAGVLRSGDKAVVIDRYGNQTIQKIGQLFRFDGLGRSAVSHIDAGDLFAVVGLKNINIGDTIADPECPVPLQTLPLDEPTIHMTIRVNDGPFSGREGTYLTGGQIRQRLSKELQTNIALHMEERDSGFVVSGRGLLHLGILLENMRREGYEFTVGKPEVIFHNEGGRLLEPIEHMVISVPTGSLGVTMQLLGERCAEMVNMSAYKDRTHMEYDIPARGLMGLQNCMMTATQGEAIMHHRFKEYGHYRGKIAGRGNGVMIALETGQVTAYALNHLADRGKMFVVPGEKVYEGQIVGEHCRDSDITVNVVKQKALTNMRSATKDATVTLKAPKKMELEVALEYIDQDELVELTPLSIRMRKRFLKEVDRRRQSRQRITS
ncbi:MAG: translational GTPase TypA [Candidatus Tritonobacter lacicola]|nr:translational GTPase TypA [Candidatus Tritonobacter lacicola]